MRLSHAEIPLCDDIFYCIVMQFVSKIFLFGRE